MLLALGVEFLAVELVLGLDRSLFGRMAVDGCLRKVCVSSS